ncbi:cytoplasmic glycerophosphodiester phosphodiesterase [uncultured Clostridium sp.]|uniref:glycerophosphodiester phosphodiesterase family protein n=1 Tax=uncultured Clostridium sp. TaxID=59620 RepID=UPI000821AF35|nr:glycerophosphodiester phosphodiesterase family protein [uncultured Clostridium sp.]SCK04451.1 cytoplasmic glycerophosphodiester phosphodiesterase [uncultured Clostridium sp.]
MAGNFGKIAVTIGLDIFILILVYIFLIYGDKKDTEETEWLTNTKFAHRGLYSDDGMIPENSLEAFKKAIENNYGIELDVSFTKDKKTVVFHDDNLLRMTGLNKKISDCTLEELQSLYLNDTDYKIPTFNEVLELVDGKVPLIIEIKSNRDRDGLCNSVKKELNDYNGRFCIESFDPLIMSRIKKNMPDVIRGQLSMKFTKDNKAPKSLKIALEYLLLNFKSRPHFIAYNWIDSDNLSLRVLRKLGIMTVAWTVNSEKALEVSNERFDTIIFEHCEPLK